MARLAKIARRTGFRALVGCAIAELGVACSNPAAEFIPVPAGDWKTEILAVGNETRAEGHVIDASSDFSVRGALRADAEFEALVFAESAVELGLTVGPIATPIPRPMEAGVSFRLEQHQWRRVEQPGSVWARLLAPCSALPRVVNTAGCSKTCEGTLTPLGGCLFDFDACRLSGGLDLGTREVSVTRPLDWECRVVDPATDGSILAIDCARCGFELFPIAPPELPIRRLEAVVAAPQDCQACREDLVSYDLSDLAVTRERIVLLERRCNSNSPSKLISVDPESLEVLGTATSTRCISRIVAEPGTDRIVAIGDELIEKLELDGTVLRRLASVDGVGEVTDVALNDSGSLLAVLSSASSTMLTLDLSDFTSRVLLPLTTPWTAVGAGPRDGFILVDFDRWAKVSGGEVELYPGVGRSGVTYDFVFDARLSIIVSTANDGVQLISEVSPLFVDVDLPAPDLVSSLARWPSGASQFLVSTFRGNVWILDATARSFVWGSNHLGRGILGPMQTDEKGRVWALLPEEGKLIRLEPEERE